MFLPGAAMIKGGKPVDKDNYVLETFDFVIKPGFKQALPALVESEEKMMNAEMEALVKARDEIQGNLMKALSDNETLRAKNEALTKTVQGLGESKIPLMESIAKGIPDKDFAALNEAYVKAGAPADVVFKFMSTLNEEAVRFYRENTNLFESLKGIIEIGEPVKVAKALDEAKDVIASYVELGTPKEISEALDKLDTVLTSYKDLGTVEELKALKDAGESLKKELEQKRKDSMVESLSKIHRVKIEGVRSLCESLGYDEEKVDNVLSNISGKLKPSGKEASSGGGDELSEGLEERIPQMGSRAARLMGAAISAEK